LINWNIKYRKKKNLILKLVVGEGELTLKTIDNQLIMNSVQKRFIGKTFNKLTVLSFAEYRKDEILKSGRLKRAAYYLCQCSCGNTKIIKGKFLKNGDSKSCGCLISETTIEKNIRRRKLTSYFPHF